MRKFLVLLTVLCLLQIFQPVTISSLSTPQSKVTVDENIITNAKLIDVTNGVGGESVNLLV